MSTTAEIICTCNADERIACLRPSSDPICYHNQQNGPWPGDKLDDRPIYILASRAQALDRVQELIAPGDGPWVDPPLPTQEQWKAIVIAAFPPPPMAGA